MAVTRRTNQRQAVLRVVKMSPKPLSAEDVLRQLQSNAVAQATVYRNLEWLSQRGEIYRFADDSGITRYIGHTVKIADFQCQRCGQRWHVDTGALKTAEEAMSKIGRPGFIRMHATGVCTTCEHNA